MKIKVIILGLIIVFVSCTKKIYPSKDGLYIYKSYTMDYTYRQVKNYYVIRFFNKQEGVVLDMGYSDTINYSIPLNKIMNSLEDYKKRKPEAFFKYKIEGDSIFFNDNQFAPTMPLEYRGKIESDKIIFKYKILNPLHNWGKYAALVDKSTIREFVFYPSSSFIEK